MPQNSLATLPWGFKILAVVIGAIFALTLTGDIDKNGKLNLNIGVLIKISFSAFLGLVGGAFIVEHGHWELSVMGQSFVSMMVSVFGMLIVGIIYQSIKFTTQDKSLAEIISEIKQAFFAIFK